MAHFIEKQYMSVTPKQAQALIEKAFKKAFPGNCVCGADVPAVADAPSRNISYRTTVKDGVRTTVDYTIEDWERIDYDNGYCDYVKNGYKTTIEETDEVDHVEIYRIKAGEYQYYRKDAESICNVIVEFDYWSDTKGTCYYYEVM